MSRDWNVIPVGGEGRLEFDTLPPQRNITIDSTGCLMLPGGSPMEKKKAAAMQPRGGPRLIRAVLKKNDWRSCREKGKTSGRRNRVRHSSPPAGMQIQVLGWDPSLHAPKIIGLILSQLRAGKIWQKSL